MSSTRTQHTVEFHQALETCPFDRLRTSYLYAIGACGFREMLRGLNFVPVTKAEMDADADRVRQTMEEHFKLIPVEPPPGMYRLNILQQLKSMGGVKITAVVNKKKADSYVYTCGFTAVGGKELLVQNVHRSWSRALKTTLNYLYSSHKEGHPLEEGHTINYGSFVFFVHTPENKVESTLLKATKTLEPTRLYGLAGYEILVIAPVGIRCSNDDTRQPTREEALLLAVGFNIGGFRSLVEHGEEQPTKAKKNTLCAWCCKSSAELQKSLSRCSACKDAFYCSSRCQHFDWKNHKVECRRSKEESFELAMNFVNPGVGKKQDQSE